VSADVLATLPVSHSSAMAYSRIDGRPLAIRRGSKRRMRRITMRGNWSAGLVILIVFILLVLFVALPWLIRHPPLDHDPGGETLLRSGTGR